MQRGGRILSIGSLGYSQGKNVRGDCFAYPHNGRRARTLRGWPPPRDEALLEVELLGQQCPKTDDAVPRYEAVVKLPGMPLNKRFIRKVPKLSAPDNHQPTPASGAYLDPHARLEKIWKLECDLSKPESESSAGKDASETVKQPESNEFADESVVYFTSLKLDRQRAIELILKLKNEMKHNQTEIIWMLWNARPGKTKAYETAVSEYKESPERIILMKGAGAA
jgi:hypothetical protein